MTILEEKIDAIRKYLSDKFPDCEIEQSPRHTDGVPWSFQIQLPDATFLLLKVNDAFVKDYDIFEILNRFDFLYLTQNLKKWKGVLVSKVGSLHTLDSSSTSG